LNAGRNDRAKLPLGIPNGRGDCYAVLRMNESADLLLFDHIVRRVEVEGSLETAALVVAEAEYPGLDVARYLGRLDKLGRRARRLVANGNDPGLPSIAPILGLVYDEMGFQGNADAYYDPRNSFLNEVMDRKLGIPITLAIVLMAICRRAGVAAQGVPFPGHFLVRAADVDGGPLFVDPFDGRVLDADSLTALYEQATGENAGLDADCLKPASSAQIVARLLNNLRAIYEVRGDDARLRSVLQRLSVLSTGSAVDDGLSPVESPFGLDSSGASVN